MLKRDSQLKLALPKGRMAEGVAELLTAAGVRVRSSARQYRPEFSLPGFEVKILKPQAIVEMLHAGPRDLGFTGADWVAELGGDLVELLDTGLDPTRLVAAAPAELLANGSLPNQPLVVASEFERIAREWIERRGLDAKFIRSFGATEVYPPEDADCIIDIAASGATLQANGLQVVDELMTSSTRLYANPAILRDASRKRAVEDFVLLLRSVLEARQRVMLEMNVRSEDLEKIVSILPCMREPTISPLHDGAGYAVKVAAPRDSLPALIPRVKAMGGSDIVVSGLSQIVP